MVTKKIYLKNTDELIGLVGKQDENLRRLERDYSVQIFVRQSSQAGDFSLVVRGSGPKVEHALKELEDIRAHKAPEPKAQSFFSGSQTYDDDSIYITFHGKHIKPRSTHQKKYVESINDYDLVFGIGPAGTGKTFLAVASALRALQRGKVSRIVLTRPVVEAGEKLGFLPGDLYEKINPYLKPLYDAFYVLLGPEKFKFMREDETIEIVPLAYMRGRTIDDAFVILDEAQNTTSEQMKMFLTRIGSDAQVVVTGDITQIDLEDKKKSGLIVAQNILETVEGVKTIHFTEEDVVRHQLVKKIIKAYSDWEKKC
jgi:phosphate starvation-inducible PhoH-like protein